MKYLIFILVLMLASCSVIPEHEGVAKIATERAVYKALNQGLDISQYKASGICKVSEIDLCAGTDRFGVILMGQFEWAMKPRSWPARLPGRVFSDDEISSDKLNDWIQSALYD